LLAALETPATDVSWGDVGKAALLDFLRGLTGGTALDLGAGKLGLGDGADAAALAAAQRASEQARQRQMIYVLAGVGGAVVIAALLLRR
jgi:hypothetical protein